MFTYPSEYITLPNGYTAMIVYEITSTTGLQAWIDYIPVQWNTSDTAPVNTFNYDGCILVSSLTSVTGKVAGIDYIKVYEVSSGTPWIDYIPVFKASDWLTGDLQLENNQNILLEDGSLILLEG